MYSPTTTTGSPSAAYTSTEAGKYIGLFEKNETREAIETVEDIYKFATQLRDAASRYADPGAD